MTSAQPDEPRQWRRLGDVLGGLPHAIWLYDGDERRFFVRTPDIRRHLAGKVPASFSPSLAQRGWDAMQDWECGWYGANLHCRVGGEVGWFLRLVAADAAPDPSTARDPATIVRLGDLFAARRDHVFADLNLGNSDPGDDHWLEGSWTGDHLLAGEYGVTRGDDALRAAFLQQDVVAVEGHIFIPAVRPILGDRDLYLVTDTTELGHLRSARGHTAAPRLAPQTLIRELDLPPSTMGSFRDGDVSTIREVGGEWYVGSADLSDGWHFLAFHPLPEGVAGDTQMQTVFGADGYASQEEAISAGFQVIREVGATPRRYDEKLARLMEDQIEAERRRERRAQIERAVANQEVIGWRGDAALIKHIAERWDVPTALARQRHIAHVYVGPRIREFMERREELKARVPVLDYRPWKDVLFDFGLNIVPRDDEELSRGAGSLFRVWIRVTESDHYAATRHLLAPFSSIKLPDTGMAGLTDHLAIEVWMQNLDGDYWMMPFGSIVSVEDWLYGSFVRSDAMRSWTEEEWQEFKRYGAVIASLGPLAMAYVTQMPELLYEERPRPRSLAEQKHNAKAKKPHTRTDLPSYRLYLPGQAPRPAKEPQGGTHASPYHHDRAGSRHTFFHPRYYREDIRQIAGPGRYAIPAPAEVHYHPQHERPAQRTPGFISGRASDATVEVWVQVGPKWFPLEPRWCFVSPTVVGPVEYEGPNGTSYRVVDPTRREAGARALGQEA